MTHKRIYTLLRRRVCDFSENTIILNRLHVCNCVRIIEVSDNRGTDNRGRTVLRREGAIGERALTVRVPYCSYSDGSNI